jgi:hypothetical protein
MAAPSINTVAVLATMAGRGKYTFQPQKIAKAKSGKRYASGDQSAEWVFPYLTQTEWDWWITQLAGDVSHTLTAAELWDRSMTAQSFTAGELCPPVDRGGFYNGLYHDVLVVVDVLMPLLT